MTSVAFCSVFALVGLVSPVHVLACLPLSLDCFRMSLGCLIIMKTCPSVDDRENRIFVLMIISFSWYLLRDTAPSPHLLSFCLWTVCYNCAGVKWECFKGQAFSFHVSSVYFFCRWQCNPISYLIIIKLCLSIDSEKNILW